MYRFCLDKCGGGVGLLYKDFVIIKKIEDGEKELFEFVEWNIINGFFRVRLVVFYWLFYFEDYFVIIVMFLVEFLVFMEIIILVLEFLIIVGDFNIYVDCSDDCNDVFNFFDFL